MKRRNIILYQKIKKQKKNLLQAETHHGLLNGGNLNLI